MAKVTTAGESEEAVAYALLFHIAHGEDKVNSYSDQVFIQADKDWVLNTYRDCLKAVQDRV